MHQPTNQPDNPWIIFTRESLTEAIAKTLTRLGESNDHLIAAVVEELSQAGKIFKEPAPFILLRTEAKDDKLPHGLALSESVDWVITEAVAEAVQAASQDDLPAGLIEAACAWVLPTIFESAKLSVRVLMNDAAQEIVADAGATPKASAKRILAARQKAFKGTGLMPLPRRDYDLLVKVLESATRAAKPYGLNAYQLFADGRIDRILSFDPHLNRFQQLSPARQEEARLWVIGALGWFKLYMAQHYVVPVDSSDESSTRTP
ncbi:MAG: hypothetical protein F9K30_24070 [Dechloromonas sp.]|nr:MAG: hypothetical protein F9K30_24070 [Dechloromonas sp.]